MLGYRRWTAARTRRFSDDDPNCDTRDNAFRAWLGFSIGYARRSGIANADVGNARRSALDSFPPLNFRAGAFGDRIDGRLMTFPPTPSTFARRFTAASSSR